MKYVTTQSMTTVKLVTTFELRCKSLALLKDDTNTVIHHIMTFRSMEVRIYDGGPIR